MERNLFLKKANEKTEGFEKWLTDFLQELGNPSCDARKTPLASVALRLYLYQEELMSDVAKIRSLLEAIRALRQANCPGRQRAEQEIMGNLAILMMDTCCRIRDGQGEKFLKLDAPDGVADLPIAVFETMREIYAFALECFGFVRNRDSFGGRRRMLAFEISNYIGEVFDLPEVVSIARQSLRKIDSKEASSAADFLTSYYGFRNWQLEREEVSALEKLAERTVSYSNAMSALNALTRAGEISEMGALSRIDEWKEKHYGA